jgi:Zn-dependent protease with chaperone function
MSNIPHRPPDPPNFRRDAVRARADQRQDDPQGRPRTRLLWSRATGRNPKHAAVAVAGGLLRQLPAEQVTSVLAHGFGHINNHDILVSSTAFIVALVLLSLLRGGGESLVREHWPTPRTRSQTSVISPALLSG